MLLLLYATQVDRKGQDRLYKPDVDILYESHVGGHVGDGLDVKRGQHILFGLAVTAECDVILLDTHI